MIDSDASVGDADDDVIELVGLPDKTINPYTCTTTAKTANSPMKVANRKEPDSSENQNEDLKSNRADAADMRRMGKEQTFDRDYRFVSIAAFTAIATASWEIGLFVLRPGLVDGGRAGLLWSALWSFIGFGPIYLSMAEMASMAPIAGAQYHWVSEFAPASCQRFLSYLTGWTSTLAWQAGNALGVFLAGSLVQTMILINNENYAFPPWQGTLLAIAAVTIAYIGSVFGSKALPYFTNVIFFVHIMAYLAYIIPVWVSAPTASHHQVWRDFQGTGGWSSITLSILVGQLSGISQQVGVDTASHMSEEVRNANLAIPKTMIIIYVVNFMLYFTAVVTVCYHVPDLQAALNDPTSYPAVYVLRYSMSIPWTIVMLTVICLLNMASNIAYLSAVMRDLFAFARDEGLPFSKWLSTVDPKRKLPVNACRFSCGVGIALSLIYIGSSVAFYAITSLLTVALLQCYSLSIGCVLWRRIYHPQTLPPAPFSLGKWGIPVNAAAVGYGSWSFFWCFWPQTAPVTASGFNWASVIFVATLVVAIFFFYFKAKNRYEGPVTYVQNRDRIAGRGTL